MDYSTFLQGVYQEQLGREPDSAGAAHWLNALQNNVLTPDQVRQQINQSLEGQNFDTQVLTSTYRQMFNRNPEQEGFQYWLSRTQSTPDMQGQALREIIGAAAQGIDAVKYADVMSKAATAANIEMPSLEADPYGGRYATTSIYDVTPEAVNISDIGGRQVQFVAPVTQRPVISQFDEGAYAAKVGTDVLSSPVVNAAVQRAIASGTLDQQDYNKLYTDLRTAKSMDDVYTALNKPRAQVVVDALYGFQVGEGKTLEQAQTEAGVRTPYVQEFGYYPSNIAVADVLQKAGIEYPFGPEAFTGYDTMMTQENVVTPQNLRQNVANLINTIYGQANFVPTEITPGYYSERGFEPTYTPLGTAPTFRSGVAGYIPPSEVPRGFEFGTTPAMVPNPQLTPAATFVPGPFDLNQLSQTPIDYTQNPVIGYTANGQPIYAPAVASDTGGGG